MNLPVRSLALSALLGVVAAPALNAQSLAFDTLGGNTGQYGFPGTAGYTFTVQTAIRVTELNTMKLSFQSASIPVGIWNSTGTLLTSAILSVGTPATTTPSASGFDFIGASIAPLILTPGTYTIGAYGSGPDQLFVTSSVIAAPEVSYGASGFTFGGALAQPNVSFPGTGAFGPSFKFSLVPAPAALPLFACLASAGSVLLRRRRK